MDSLRLQQLEQDARVKYVFISEYFKFHLEPLCKALREMLGDDFLFVETGTYTRDLEITNNLADDEHTEYTISLYKTPEYEELVKSLVISADVVILGFGQRCYEYNELRMMNNNKALTFKIKERLFRWGIDKKNNPEYHDRVDYKYTNWFKCAHYILCVSAYTAYDMQLLGAREDHLLQFGYWTTPSTSTWEELSAIKDQHKPKTRMLWVGRFIILKHPDVALRLLHALHNANVELIYIGYGPEEDHLKQMTVELGLEKQVQFLGVMNRFHVREQMKKADILLATSDYREGWSMVIPEAMSEGCCVVSSRAAGAAPVLITEACNGFCFDHRDCNDLIDKIRKILNDGDAVVREVGEKAYRFIINEWDASIAASRLIELSKHYLETGTLKPFEEGICSLSKIIPGSESIDK